MGLKKLVATSAFGAACFVGGVMLADRLPFRIPEPIAFKADYEIPKGSMLAEVDLKTLFEDYGKKSKKYKGLNVPELAVLLGMRDCMKEKVPGLKIGSQGKEFAKSYNSLAGRRKSSKTIVNHFYIEMGEEKDFMKLAVDTGTYGVKGTPAKVRFKGDISAYVYDVKDTIFVDMEKSNIFLLGNKKSEIKVNKLKLIKQGKNHFRGEYVGETDGKKVEDGFRLSGYAWVSSVKYLFGR